MSSGFLLSGFFLAVSAVGLFFLAALAVVGIWVPFGWWRVLAMGGAILSLSLMAAFFGAAKVLPMVLDRCCKEAPVVTDSELQVPDYLVFDYDLQAGIALDLRDGV